jgi:hypothetical protein
VIEEHPTAAPQLAVALAAWLDASPAQDAKEPKK